MIYRRPAVIDLFSNVCPAIRARHIQPIERIQSHSGQQVDATAMSYALAAFFSDSSQAFFELSFSHQISLSYGHDRNNMICCGNLCYNVVYPFVCNLLGR